MSPVWRVARAAVRRRRLQTLVIGVVVLTSTAALVMALALLVASTAPFEQAMARQRGPHLTASFDPAVVSGADLAATAERPIVAAAAGPFAVAVVELAGDQWLPGLSTGGSISVVGRPEPGGPVDAVDLWQGRWVAGPGEVVLNLSPDGPPGAVRLGQRVQLVDGPALTVVGLAHSLSHTADAWVWPAQAEALSPTATQMLYRFTEAETTAEVAAAASAVTAPLPPGALLSSQSYLLLRDAFAAELGLYVPFLLAFGVLGLVVAVLIVANVVSGAVVSGFRHIGILKGLGFTPRQVLAVHLTMVGVPGVAGSLLGTLLGHLAAQPLLTSALRGLAGGQVGVTGWVDLAALLGMPAVVLAAALVPGLRAYRLSAAEAISAGSAPRPGRGLRVQRWLAGTRLPRPVSLGLGIPLARPARTTLTLAAVLLGVTTVTFAAGLASSVTRYADATDHNDSVGVRANPPGGAEPTTTLTDPQVEALLRSLPGTVHLTAAVELGLSVAGQPRPVSVAFLRGDMAASGYPEQITEGRWLAGPGEVVVPSRLSRRHGFGVGDRLVLELDGRRLPVTVVGQTMAGPPGPDGALLAGWETYARLAPDRPPASHEVLYQVQLADDAGIAGYLAAVSAADPGLSAWDNRDRGQFTVAIVALASASTVLLGTVAALGVFNTVVLNVRERRRDLGMLKSIGMTPRQVTLMVVTSMAALGAAGGLLGAPVGVLAHRILVPVAAGSAQVSVTEHVLAVWRAPVLGLLVLAGVAIAVLGALVPAQAAARLPIAQVLHNE